MRGCWCRAKERCAAGIIETMEHFQKIPEDAALPPAARATATVANVMAFRTRWANGAASTPGAVPCLLPYLAQECTDTSQQMQSSQHKLEDAPYKVEAGGHRLADTPFPGWFSRVVLPAEQVHLVDAVNT